MGTDRALAICVSGRCLLCAGCWWLGRQGNAGVPTQGRDSSQYIVPAVRTYEILCRALLRKIRTVELRIEGFTLAQKANRGDTDGGAIDNGVRRNGWQWKAALVISPVPLGARPR